MKSALLAIACVLLSQLPASAEAPKVIKVGTKPESVCRGFDGKLYVTMINGEEPGDGGINVVDGEEVKEFCRGMNSPKGIAYVGDFLVVADVTTVWKVNAEGKVETLAELKDFPEPVEFLNDVSGAPDGKGVYITDMRTPGWMFDPDKERTLWPLDSDKAVPPGKAAVYFVGLDGKVKQEIPPGDLLTGANGVTAFRRGDRQRILLGDFFTGKILAWNGEELSVFAEGMRGADGIEVGRGVIYVSSWPLGKVWKYERREKKLTLLSEDFTTAADLYYDRENNQLIVPDMIEGTLTFLPVE